MEKESRIHEWTEESRLGDRWLLRRKTSLKSGACRFEPDGKSNRVASISKREQKKNFQAELIAGEEDEEDEEAEDGAKDAQEPWSAS